MLIELTQKRQHKQIKSGCPRKSFLLGFCFICCKIKNRAYCDIKTLAVLITAKRNLHKNPISGQNDL